MKNLLQFYAQVKRLQESAARLEAWAKAQEIDQKLILEEINFVEQVCNGLKDQVSG